MPHPLTDPPSDEQPKRRRRRGKSYSIDWGLRPSDQLRDLERAYSEGRIDEVALKAYRELIEGSIRVVDIEARQGPASPRDAVIKVAVELEAFEVEASARVAAILETAGASEILDEVLEACCLPPRPERTMAAQAEAVVQVDAMAGGRHPPGETRADPPPTGPGADAVDEEPPPPPAPSRKLSDLNHTRPRTDPMRNLLEDDDWHTR